jgi:hypothetical protein
MGDVLPLFDPSNYQVAGRRIKKLLIEGTVVITPHAQKQMTKRKMDITDVQYILRYGLVVDHSRPMELWRYKVKGKTVDGIVAGCIVEINGHLIIVTVTKGGKT